MGTADEQIRVSDRVKRELERRKREGESYNDVLERVFDERTTGDFHDADGGPMKTLNASVKCVRTPRRSGNVG